MSGSAIGSGSLALTIWGDSVVGPALTLLLRGPGYEVKFLSAKTDSQLGQPLPSKGTSLLVLTPTPQLSTEEREACLALLRNTPGYTNIPVLELVMLSEESPERRTRDESWYMVSWPCRLEELVWRIEAALSYH